jgi:hypothetical protein
VNHGRGLHPAVGKQESSQQAAALRFRLAKFNAQKYREKFCHGL